jgi:hypothetical protein
MKPHRATFSYKCVPFPWLLENVRTLRTLCRYGPNAFRYNGYCETHGSKQPLLLDAIFSDGGNN